MKADWKIKPLGEACEFSNGQAHEKCIDDTGKFKLINSKFVSSEGQHFKRTNNALSPLYENDIAIVMSDVPNGKTLAKCFLVDKNDTYTLNQRIGVIRSNNFDTRFLYYQLNRNKHFLSFNNGENQTNLRKGDIVNCKLLLPSLAEQKRIVTILDQAFEGIATATANAKKNLANARELFESELQSVFTDRHEGWLEKPLGELCDLITKGSSPKWQGISYVDKAGVLFVTSENVGEYQLIMDKPKYVEEKFNVKDKKSILRKGDVLTNIVGASIGRTAIFDLDLVANINQAVCLLRCNSLLLDNRYLTYLLNSPVLKQILHDNEVNNARANLSLGFFSQLSVPMPSVAEQRQIVVRFDECQTETKKLEAIYQQKLLALEELKKSILNQAFSGQL